MQPQYAHRRGSFISLICVVLAVLVVGVVEGHQEAHRRDLSTYSPTEYKIAVLDRALRHGYVDSNVYLRARLVLEKQLANTAHAMARNVMPMRMRERRGDGEQTGCPLYNGKECNGSESGKCEGMDCQCEGGWTGIACHWHPDLSDYDPLLGSSEPDDDCKVSFS